MGGRFYNNDRGIQARDMLLAGRRFGVSVDPGAVEMEFTCTEEDDEGFCIDGTLDFLAYEVYGLTMTPFPGFETAHIMLAAPDAAAPQAPEADDEPEAEAAAAAQQGSTALAEAPCCDTCAARALAEEESALLRRLGETLDSSRLRHGIVAPRTVHGTPRELAAVRSTAVAASGGPVRPPAAWFENPGLMELTPLTITDEGRVYGHLAPWGQCHIGYQGECVQTPMSRTNYAYFRLSSVICDDGSEVATGRITYGGGHADLSLSFRGAVEHYDNAGTTRADVAAGEDAHGIWIAGAMRPGVSAEQIRELRGASLSGDWRPVGGGLEMCAALAVNVPGLPITRTRSRVASGGRVLALVAAGASVMAHVQADPSEQRLARLEAQLAAMRAEQTAPARARLRTLERRRQADRLRRIAQARLRAPTGR
jgi:hypothetical protein